jgi:hypothetical protein
MAVPTLPKFTTIHLFCNHNKLININHTLRNHTWHFFKMRGSSNHANKIVQSRMTGNIPPRDRQRTKTANSGYKNANGCNHNL